MTETKVALGISPTGQPIPIQLTPAGLLAVSGGSGWSGPGAFVDGMVILGIASNGIRVPLSVDANGIVQTSGGSGGGSGTVTSVDLTVPSILTVSGNPITTSGTLAITLATQSANTIFAGPTSGGAATPAFRSLVGADLPAIITKSTTFNIAGAASVPALIVSGGPFAGTGTTSFPQLYINDSTATPSTTLSTAGTYLGVNGHGTADLQNWMLDGVSKLKVGTTVITATVPFRAADGLVGAPSYSFINSPTSGMYADASGNLIFSRSGTTQLQIRSGTVDLGSSVLTWGSSFDVVLARDAANTLAQRNGVNAQQFNLYGTYTDASNYERMEFGYDAGGPTFYLAATKAGTGTARGIAFYINGAYRWQMDTSGNFSARANYNIWNGTSALATNATAGFLGVNSCAGIPTGVPTSIPTGQIPMVVDSTNSKLMAYIGGAWKGIVLV